MLLPEHLIAGGKSSYAPTDGKSRLAPAYGHIQCSPMRVRINRGHDPTAEMKVIFFMFPFTLIGFPDSFSEHALQ